MLSPVREDTLAYHANQLKWMGYPFTVLLVINLTCVLYAVSRTSLEGDLSAPAMAEVTTDPAAHAPVHVVAPELDGPVVTMSEVRRRRVAERTAPTLDDEMHGGPRFVQPGIAPLPPTAPPAGRRLSSWLDDTGAWQAEARDTRDTVTTTLSDAQRDEVSVPEIVIEIPEIETTETTTSPSSVDPVTGDGPLRRPDQLGLVVRNPVSNRGAVAFLGNGRLVTLKPGESKVFKQQKQHKVRFHRGDRFGNATYILDNGEYHFVVTKLGWTLLKDEPGDVH